MVQKYRERKFGPFGRKVSNISPLSPSPPPSVNFWATICSFDKIRLGILLVGACQESNFRQTSGPKFSSISSVVFPALLKCDSKVIRLLSHIDVTHVTVYNLRKRRGEKLLNGRFGNG